MSDTQFDKPRFARMYVKAAAKAEKRGGVEHRRRLLDGLRGTVVEVGTGHGLNFAHYPTEVTEVVAVEPEVTLRAEAEQRAAAAHVPIRVVAGVADELPVPDGTADAVVTSLVLCSVPNQARALAEAWRVLKPGGELRFYEHVIPSRHPKRGFIQLIDRSGIWPAIAGGCHPARDTTAAIQSAGFDIETIERFGFSASAIEPSIPHILGTARRPS